MSQMAPKRLDEPTPIRSDMPEQTIGAMLDQDRRELREQVNGLAADVAKVEQMLTTLLEDPTAFIRLQPGLLSTEDAAELTGYHPKTIAGYTRLPEDHPNHLPRVDDHPIRILPGELADWILRDRAS